MYLNSNSSGKSLAPRSTRKKPLASQPLERALKVHLTFLCISLPFLRNYDVKLPNFTL